MSHDPDVIRRIILRQIPLGSKSSGAIKEMSSEGYSCREYHNDEFITYSSGKEVVHKNLDFVFCQKVIYGPYGATYNVVFIEHDNRITEVSISILRISS